MLAEQWIMLVLLGMLLGGIGQFLRVGMGLYKKMQRDTDSSGSVETVSLRRLSISVIGGAVAGALAAIGIDGTKEPVDTMISSEVVLAIIAAGYSGADFVEGFVRARIPKSKPA